MRSPVRYFALIPAAGVGARMGRGGPPKQYLPLGGRSMLEHSLDAMLADPRIERVCVIVAPGDTRWRAIPVRERVGFLQVGGASRAETVRNGLAAMAASCVDDDRVLVHDAARPCLGSAQLADLIDAVGLEDDGGLLAVPLTDTLKRGADGRSAGTVDRSSLWCAQTPQLFRFGSLRAALAGALDGLTDEASAMERLGHAPRLVPGVVSNLKVTTPEDMVVAAAVLRAQGRIAVEGEA